MTTDKREAEIDWWISEIKDHLEGDHERGCDGRTYSCGCGYDDYTVTLFNKALDQLATLRQSLSDALAIAQDWERQSRAAADSLLLVGMEHDTLRQSLSAAEARVKDWRPIETAPKDGRNILLWWRTCSSPAIGCWACDDREDWLCHEGWRCDGDQCIPVNQADCTHWMPLPAPPPARASD